MGAMGRMWAEWGERGNNGGKLGRAWGTDDRCGASSSIAGQRGARASYRLPVSLTRGSRGYGIRDCYLVAHRVGADLLRRHIKVRAEPRDVGTGRHGVVLTKLASSPR